MPIIAILSLVVAGCNKVEFNQEMQLMQLKDVKTITTRFESHQSDTQQKTGKIVAIASFLPDGTLDEFVQQTTYPYDHEFDTKKDFWEQPDKAGIPYIMDGLSLGEAEKSILYGSDWPSSFAKHLLSKKGKGDKHFPWVDEYQIDNLEKPTEIKTIRKYDENSFFRSVTFPDVTELFVYEGEKIVETASIEIYKELDYDNHKELSRIEKLNMKEFIDRKRKNSGKRRVKSRYTYDGDLLKSLVFGKTDDPNEYKFYYEGPRLAKTEYYLRGTLVNTREHYYERGLKQRTEIFNRYNEREYTITYSYEYW